MNTFIETAVLEEKLSKHPVVSPDKWESARKELLSKEKELTRLSEEVNAARRELPWQKVEKEYVFRTSEGDQTLAELFGSNSQLFVYHFMFGPEWEEGCPGCSFLCDHVDGANLHLKHHDVSFVAVSRAPLSKLLPYKKRMGWDFKWVSSEGSDFNYDYHVTSTPEEMAAGKAYYNYETIEMEGDEHHGLSVFYKDDAGNVYHTYSAYARAGDILLGAHNFLDLTPKGRNERSTMDWVRLHDQYEDAPKHADCCCK